MRISFKRGSKLFLVVYLAVLMCLSIVVNKTDSASVYLNGVKRKLPIYSVDRLDNKISISFDCAYGADYTDSLLDTLDKYNVKCTFFVVKFWVQKYPDKVQKIIERGHEIGTHSSTHPYMSKLSNEQIAKELNDSISAITTITNKPVELFRAPYGDYDNEVISVAENLKLYTIQWDVDSLDWKDLSSSEITSRIVNKTKSGSIILCHNNGLNTHKALPNVLESLQNKGYEFVKISELIYKDNYVIDNTGKQGRVT